MAVNREQILQSAEKLLSRGKLDQALKEYLRVLEDNAKDIPTLNKVGDLYVRMNRPGESIPYFERIADFYSKDGFFLKAIAIYKKINKIDPARLEVYDRLADLYHKQGLVQDARSQYQVLADHYQKNNRVPDAITVYKKMAQIDPADLRIQVRLADLYRAANQKDQAVMQYGLIGSMLLKRGAHDEAAQVFQKALELSPDDVETQRNLVRSLLAQKNASAAMAVLKAAPRTGESLGLMAEAQLEMGERAEAVRTAEQALALDADAETPRMFLCRVRVQEMNLDKALAAVAPLVLTAVTRREFARGAEYLEPILAADPGHVGALEKLASVLEAEGNRAGARQGPRDARRGGRAPAESGRGARALPAGAGGGPVQHRGRHARPEHRRADGDAARGRRGGRAGARVPGADHRPGGFGLRPRAAAEGRLDRVRGQGRGRRRRSSRLPLPAPAEVAAAAAAAAEAPAGEEQQVETLIVEAEVFARYGLADKAIERLFSLVRRRPDLLKARERLVELLAETRNPGLSREAEALAAAYNEAGRPADASRILARAGHDGGEPELPHPAAAAPPPAPGLEVEFEEFDVGHAPAAPPAEMGSTAAPYQDDGIEFVGGEAGPPPAMEKLSTPQPQTPADTEFVSYEQLGNLLEDEMHRAGESEAPAASSTEVPAVDEENLFSDEQKFFNLAEELEKDLGDEIRAEESSEINTPQGEVSLEEIFREFKKGVEQQLSAEDYETHYNLGIAYKEMGLVDEAIGEFQLASKDPGRAVECCSMLGHCFLEKGMPQLAIKWFRKGLESPGIVELATAGMLYDLAQVYQDTGDTDSAYRTFQEVYGLNANYRDVVRRVKELDAVRKNP